jgi:hypothetical protein
MPRVARVLHTWIAQAQDSLGSVRPRLGWLVAATVITAALQRAVNESGTALFLLKGGKHEDLANAWFERYTVYRSKASCSRSPEIVGLIG